MRKLPAAGIAPLLATLPNMAHANDTMAELAAGGLTFVYADDVAMQSEDLFISPKQVRVDYVFHNGGNQDRTTVVAFPMPDIERAGEFRSIPQAPVLVQTALMSSSTVDNLPPIQPREFLGNDPRAVGPETDSA